MANSEKFWSVGVLRGRGWSEELIGELLPRPTYRHLGNRRVRTWNRGIVRQAEESEQFIRAKLQRNGELEKTNDKSRRQSGGVRGALERAEEYISELWAAGPRPEGDAGRLAELYHRGILKRIPSSGWADRLRNALAASYIGHFAALEREGSGQALCTVLKHFIMAMPFIGRNPGDASVQRLGDVYVRALTAAAERSVNEFRTAQPEADLEGLLNMEDFPAHQLLNQTLGYIYSVEYVPRAIRTSLEVLVALNPKDEYPEARAMRRHFIIHTGGTNTGKTYAGFQRLKEAATGVYLAPLRLLALEAQEIMLDAGVDCSLTTGEEEDVAEGDTHVAATAEKLDLSARYDVAVIDECQMISDRQRGYAWTRAILGVLAPEVHLCCAPQAKDLLLRIIRSCGDTFEVVEHKRKTPLICMKRMVDYSSLQPGDALITFSKIGVLSAAEDLRARGKKPAIIYGALPYSTRRAQMEGFLNGDMQYVVSTDAIGMGLNLPIRRIIFMETRKFDGVESRDLKPEEIQQIAGRAGRYGMYDRGYVGAMDNLSAIRAGLDTVVPPLQYAVAGFSDLVLTVDFDLLEVLEVWNRMPTADPYIKLDISRYITIISKLREQGLHLTKEEELRAANIPFDETEDELLGQFHKYLRAYASGQTPEQPQLPAKSGSYTLPELELHCRELDLWFSFAKAFGYRVDMEALRDEREDTADRINQILLHNLKNNIRFCARCGAALPLHGSGRLCNNCYRALRAIRIR